MKNAKTSERKAHRIRPLWKNLVPLFEKKNSCKYFNVKTSLICMKNTFRRNSLSTLVHFYVHVVILFFLLSLFFKTSFTGAGCVQKTTTGQCCSIPFTYKGVKYHSCTTADHNQLWCSLDAVYKGKWGNCGKHWNNAGIK